MTKPYSMDLRTRIMRGIESGQSVRAVGAAFSVSPSCVVKLAQLFRRTGTLEAKPQGGDRRYNKIEAHRAWLLEQISNTPDMTLEEIRERLHGETGMLPSISTIWRFFDRHGISLKKTAHASEQERPDVKAARTEWKSNQLNLDPSKLVFLDETAVTTNMARMRGRCKRGERLVSAVPFGHWKTTTFVAGLRHDGIVAPLVIDGPMNGKMFVAYVQQFLAPTLAPGDTVVMDNLSTHKVAGVKDAIEARGARVLYLPAYSPDFNPIEQVYAKLKALLRKAAERSVDALWDRIGQLMDSFPADECKKYLAHAGYV
ncbi:MAG: IS630 family transposase [Alphaproteobacteria bacterium]|nr:IS630 family transposase [Alphaproteobacteria bacterium]